MKTIPQTKICTKCKITKELSEFAKNSSKKNGYQTQCKLCEKVYKQSHYEKNKDRILKKNKEYRDVNKEPIAEQKKEYAKQNKEYITNYQKEYAKQNKKAIADYQKEYVRQNKEFLAKKNIEYRKQNKESIKINKEKWYKQNKKAKIEYQKEYAKQNKEAVSKYKKEYAKTEIGRLAKKNSENKRRKIKVASADGTVPQKMTYPLTKELQELLHIQDYKCNNCRCDITNNNHHLDHHVPLSKGGIHSISNVVFLCPPCNLKKSATMPTTLMLVI